MEDSYRMLLIAICACLLAIAIPALIGLAVAWRLDKKTSVAARMTHRPSCAADAHSLAPLRGPRSRHDASMCLG